MAVFTNIESALNQRLNSLPAKPPIAWPNTKFTPINGVTYLRPTILPASTELSTLNRGQTHSGIYQIDINVPLDKGVNVLDALLDNLYTHFSSQDILVSGPTNVFITSIGRGRAIRQDAFYVGFIEINYLCYS